MSSRRGFVLPTTLMVMTLLTVMLTAAFILISAEFRTTDNALAMSRAHAIAQAGLQDYLTRNRGLGAASTYDSMRVTYTAGYADVVASRIVAPLGGKIGTWLVRSTGTLTGGMLTGVTRGKRVVAQLAELNLGTLPLRAALITANPAWVQNGAFGATNAVSGNDACAASNNRGATAAAGDLIGGASGITGSVENLPNEATVLDSTHIDWAALVAGNFTPDYTVPPWPGGASGYPVFLANGNYTLPSIFGFHQGILVVTGNLTMPAFGAWNGVVLVGGHARATSNLYFIRGTMVTGLNNQITPGSVGRDSIPQGFITSLQWDSCQSASAVAAMAAMAPMRNGWIDTWSTY